MVLGQALTALLCKSTETGLVAKFAFSHIIYLQNILATAVEQLSGIPGEGKFRYNWYFGAHLSVSHSTLCPCCVYQPPDLAGISHEACMSKGRKAQVHS